MASDAMGRRRKEPKDIELYDESRIAAGKLIQFALNRLLFFPGKVRWKLTIFCHEDNEADNKGLVSLVRGTFSNKVKEVVRGE